MCYTLCRRCRENAVAVGEGKGIWNGRKTGLWLRGVEPQAQDWFHQQTGRIWKPPYLVFQDFFAIKFYFKMDYDINRQATNNFIAILHLYE